MLCDLEHLDRIRDGWLLDTNIISAVIGSKPIPPGIARFFDKIDDSRIYLSVLTIGEMRKGAVAASTRAPRKDGGAQPSEATMNKYRDFGNKLDALVEMYAARILPIDTRVADQWGNMLGQWQSAGEPVPAIDSLIAATAYVHNLVVVSNDAVFRRIRDVTFFDPIASVA